MYLNRWVLLLSLAIGLAGVAAVGRAFVEYRDATRAYSQVEAVYVPGSFVWLDADFATGQAELRIVNRSPKRVTVEHLDMRVNFDGQFAGADYAVWQPLVVERESERNVTQPVEIAISELRLRAPDARITLRGELRLRFDGVERPLTIRFQAPVEPGGSP